MSELAPSERKRFYRIGGVAAWAQLVGQGYGQVAGKIECLPGVYYRRWIIPIHEQGILLGQAAAIAQAQAWGGADGRACYPVDARKSIPALPEDLRVGIAKHLAQALVGG